MRSKRPHRHVLLAASLLVVAGGCDLRERWEQPAAPSVRVEIARARPHRPRIRLLGVVRPPESVPLVLVHGGRLDYPARFRRGLRTGERVSAGETLAFVENEGARHELESARLRAESARVSLERVRRAFEAGLSSRDQLDQAELEERLATVDLASAERNHGRLELVAPKSGFLVVTAPIAPGTEVAAGAALGELASHGAPRVEAWAAASERDHLSTGLEVEVRRPGRSEIAARGRLAEVAGVVDEAGTIRVVVALAPNGTEPPLPGEGVELDVLGELRPEVITVPEDAILHLGGTSTVFVLDSVAVRRAPVVTGSRADGRVEITSGLQEGDRVVVDGAERLEAGDQVKVAATAEPPGGAEE